MAQGRSRTGSRGARHRVIASAVALGLVATGTVMTTAPVSAAPTTPTLRAPAAKPPLLTVGSTGPQVQQVQARLGVIQTGFYGDLTANAVRTFQAQNGLAATGSVSAATWTKLFGTSSKTSTDARPKLRVGSTGPAVEDLQRRLPMPTVTGYFGTLTETYVRALQKKAKLKQTGVVNKKTWKKVGKVRVTVSTPSPTTGTAAPAVGIRKRILAIAASYQGVPYVANGYTPEQGFNCSSYTQWVFQQAGIDLGGAYTVTQYSRTTKIDQSEAKPGDLVFFYNYPNNFIGHVGIYAGNGKMWHAPRTGRVVSLDEVYSKKVLFGRVL